MCSYYDLKYLFSSFFLSSFVFIGVIHFFDNMIAVRAEYPVPLVVVAVAVQTPPNPRVAA